MSRFVSDFSSIPQRETDGRLDAPAFHRNHAPIWEAIAPRLAALEGDALEIGSGTGQHVAEFARKTPQLTWWPTDILDAHLRSIAARSADAPNIKPPQRLDLTDPDWTGQSSLPKPVSAILCINILHISPWAVSQNLFAGAAKLLRPGGHLFVYGAFKRDGAHTAESNASFDASLRAQNADWGVRDIADLSELAERGGLLPINVAPMPSNNFLLATKRL